MAELNLEQNFPDLFIARDNLAGHTICLCKEGVCLFSEKRGISPMMDLIGEGKDLSGYCVADLVVGKAAAMLFAKSGIAAVYAKTLSQSAKQYLETQVVPVLYDSLAPAIINRAGTDLCPMEKAVLCTDNAEQAYQILREKLRTLHAGNV